MTRFSTVLVILALLIPLGLVLSLLVGSSALSPDRIISGLLGKDGYEIESAILLHIRLPRALAALLAGVALSLSGVLLQHVMGNPLAGPNTVGIHAGGGLFTVIFLSLFPTAVTLLPLATFLGGFLTTALILAIAARAGGGRATVILAGIACTSLAGAGISFFTILDTDVLAQYSAFSVGGFSGVSTDMLLLPALLVGISLALSLILSRRLTVLSLGDAPAAALGIRVTGLRIFSLLLASLSAAAAISFAGLLGFVGLAVPHITRRLVGYGLFRELCTAPLLGGFLLMMADLAARTLFAPSDIPVGILTALLGAPFFLILLMKARTRHAGI